MGSIRMIAMARLLGGGGRKKTTVVPFSTGTDEEIAALIDAAHAGDVDLQKDAGWAVGDTRTISVGAFTGGGDVAHAAQSVDIVISSFDEYMDCGNVLQFDFKDALATGQRMNRTNTNSGGYRQSEMKTTTIPALVNALPDWLKSRLIEFSVLASRGGIGGAVEVVTQNKLSLRSEIEIYGTTTYSTAGEGSQIDYYLLQNSRIKKRGRNGTADNWYERSTNSGSSSGFCKVTSGGNSDYGSASNQYGLAPFGCL